MQGLTDGISSRYLRRDRSLLIPALESLRTQQSDKRVRALHGRLEELLVFEISKDGGTEYNCFNVRTLHKYIVHAITKSKESKSPQNILNDLALGKAIINQSRIPTNNATEEESGRSTNPETPSKDGENHFTANDISGDSQRADKTKDVTYRELLGGFLHPRDLRKLVTPFSASNEPELIIRRHVMLLNFDSLRAIILRDRVLLLIPDGADSILVQLEKMILGGAETAEMNPYESQTDDDSEINFESGRTSGAHLNLMDPGDLVGMATKEELDNFLETTFHQDALGQNEFAELEGNTWIDMPFELTSVDAILNRVCSILADEVLDLQLSANSLITELLTPGADLGLHAQEVLRTLKNSVREMMSRVRGFCRALDKMLDDDEEMALMNLTRLLTHPDLFIQPVSQAILEQESDEPELILEAHLQRGHTLANALNLVEGQINSTEEYVEQKSDNIRNRLLYINMMISLLSLAVAVASLVGSLFGMNVSNPLEDKATAFVILTASTVGGSLLLVVVAFFLIRSTGVLR